MHSTISLLVLAVCVMHHHGAWAAPQDGPATPILLVPGLFSSILESKFADGAKVPMACWLSNPHSWTRMWVGLLDTVNYECWKHKMSLETSPEGLSYPPPGVMVRVPTDAIHAVACLDPANPLTCRMSNAFGSLVAYLEQRGYRAGVDLDAMPYDFRLSPLNHFLPDGLFSRMRARVERMYNETGKRRVALVAHSLGGSLSMLFLNTYVSQAWKDQYIARVSLVGAPLAGTPGALEFMVTGHTQRFPFPPMFVESVTRTFTGMAFLLPANGPNGTRMWPGNSTVARLGKERFTAQGIPSLLRRFDVKFWDIVDRLAAFDTQSAPGVEVQCMVGTGHRTPMAVDLHAINVSPIPEEEHADGDGLVLAVSADLCGAWGTQQRQAVRTFRYHATHVDLITSHEALWHDVFMANY